MNGIATRLKCALGDTGFTQKELAQMTGLTEVSISRYVNGSRVPKATILARIADALGVGMGYFFDSVAKDTNVPSTDCISRQAAIDALGNAGLINYAATGSSNGLIHAMNVIKGLPAAQPQRMRGRWEDVNGDGSLFRCNICNSLVCCAKNNYCPNCGVDMRGGEQDE